MANTPHSDDTPLVKRARDGDAAAFEALVRLHQDTAYRIALRILNAPADAADATQEALVAAWRSLPDLDDPATFRAWLYRIVTRRALNAARARTPESPTDLSEGERPGRAAGPEHHTVAGGLRDALAQALLDLPPQQRVCWILYEMEEMSYSEIAETVDATPDAVRGRIHRARAHLVEALKPWR
ncbi:RNA polymerase sigma-70 factor (ECF subfamily) [Nocardiopsis mwathae]|uniref:RNA polymerase sigma-70 factor (ECF subfamily) n=1 Tax=Nocardiopsis mwathae TaxID=1472723 RepID=A0A7W9YMH9_9ACTN|nr:sigma-70 family RNA polymerase sigma factor [Nocardiopsis mwathae]MBB6174897.1 RNA polymerase sigma-70 factor (ECF subfamily) [Nocardiopsis mwathae]